MKKLNFLIIFVLSTLLFSCATKTKVEYVDREVVRYETITLHDTLINNIHDSVYHTIIQRGDTIYNTKYVEKTKWRERVVIKTDTCYRDSIQVQVRETTITKKVTPKWCYYVLALLGLFLAITIYKAVRWLR